MKKINWIKKFNLKEKIKEIYIKYWKTNKFIKIFCGLLTFGIIFWIVIIPISKISKISYIYAEERNKIECENIAIINNIKTSYENSTCYVILGKDRKISFLKYKDLKLRGE